MKDGTPKQKMTTEELAIARDGLMNMDPQLLLTVAKMLSLDINIEESTQVEIVDHILAFTLREGSVKTIE